MAADTPSQGGRRHFHRGRRGQSNRGGERRSQSPQQSPQTAEQPARGDQVDVEHIMRDIRSKISDRPGIELTDQQVQELAARRLESILDPRTIKPALLEQLRRSAGARSQQGTPASARIEPPYAFEDTTLFESPNPVVRFIRKLLGPILKLFFNPNPLIRALNIQARLNTESVKREAERDERQAEWNALHYELLQRVVSEIAKVSLEVQSLSLRIESLSAKVDFNERRVRGLEGTMHQGRPAGGRDRGERDREAVPQQEMRPQQPAAAQVAQEVAPPPAEGAPVEVATSETPRRRRRRRRGRRGGGAAEAAAQGAPESAAAAGTIEPESVDEDVDGDVAVEPEFESSTEDPVEQVEMAPDVTREPAREVAPPFSETVTTEGEKIEDVSSAPPQPEAASPPEPGPKPEAPPALPPEEPERVRLLEPASTLDDPTSERGRNER
jgi:hypothetical protein